MGMVEERKLRRLGGWQKLLADSPFGFFNQDLHDQLLDCQFYYQSFSDSIFVPRQFAGYSYPYFFPDRFFPSTTQDQESVQAYYGYYPEYIDNPYPIALVEDEWRICDTIDGYPYSLSQNYDLPNTGYPDYYSYPYFHLCLFDVIDGYTGGGYPYGPESPVYSDPYTYPYEYCGNYLYDRPGCREAISFLFEAVSVSKRRKLLAGTKSRLYVLNETSGNWRILADGLGGLYQSDNCGCSARRFKAAQLGNIVIFTNSFDPVLSWNMDVGPNGCEFWSAAFIEDLQGLGVTRAGVVASWNGFVFIGDVAIDAEAQPSRLLWSDYNGPLSWAPGGESLAGDHDFGLGERIIAIEPIGGRLLVYTSSGNTKAIYSTTIVGGDEVLHFEEIYRGPDGIEYPNSLVNIGSAHVWGGQSGIMWLGEYDRVPTRPEWIHKSSGVIYSGTDPKWLASFPGLSSFPAINKKACEQFIGGYDSTSKTIWFSWPTGANICPNMSLILNHAYGHSSVVDRGFTAFVMHRPDYQMLLRDFLATYAGCDIGLEAKEGQPYADLSIGLPVAYIRNENEDPDQPVDPNSLCARVSSMQLADFCPTCESESLFVMADAHDRTLKEFMPGGYFRERFVDSGLTYDCPYTVPGNYASDGYYSMQQGDAYDYRVHEEKLINQAIVDFEAEPQTTPNDLFFQVAYGSQSGCMIWDSTSPKPLACTLEGDETSMEAANQRPRELPTFKFYRKGAFLAWRFYVNGTGGGASFGALTLSVRRTSGEWK
jgi:hypothetical protein